MKLSPNEHELTSCEETMGCGNWGWGIGDYGFVIGDWGLVPIPNPQSPIPNPQSPIPNQRNNRVYYYLLQNKYTLILIIYSRESLSCKK